MSVDRPGDKLAAESADARQDHRPGETGAPGERADRRDSPGRQHAHADLRAQADDAYRAHAIDQGCDRVRATEATVVTPAIRRIEAEDPNRSLVGLEFRLKGRERLSEKVAEAVEERGRSIAEALGLVKDAIRYTFCYTEDRYSQDVVADCRRLEEAGFGPVDRKNSWEGDEYKGINSHWRAPGGGQIVEVQFHTRSSFEAKQETHSAYERLRALPDDEAEVRQLRAFQREVTAKVPVPPGAVNIPEYRYP